MAKIRLRPAAAKVNMSVSPDFSNLNVVVILYFPHSNYIFYLWLIKLLTHKIVCFQLQVNDFKNTV
jgi:hypothetical protein